MNTYRSALAVFVLSSALLVAAPTSAQDEQGASQAYESMAVQNRLYTQTAELSLFLGIFPLDAFTKGLSLSGSYTHHFDEIHAWEVAHGYYSFHADTDLRDDLLAHGLEPIPFEVLNWLITSNYVLKPIYWKGSLFNESLVHGEILLLVGAGYAEFTRSNRAAIDLGLAMRLYASRLFSFRIDARHHVFFRGTIFEQWDLHHELWIGFGTSLSF